MSKAGRAFVVVLTLTSLIDAFSILVIFLLSQFSVTPETLTVAEKMQLPTATQASLMAEGTVIAVSNGQYMIANKPVSLNDLTRQLVALHNAKGGDPKKSQNLIVQADRLTDYALVSPIIHAGAQAGFSQIKFAVTQGGKGS
jgi:biopolymer transport protein ExbD